MQVNSDPKSDISYLLKCDTSLTVWKNCSPNFAIFMCGRIYYEIRLVAPLVLLNFHGIPENVCNTRSENCLTRQVIENHLTHSNKSPYSKSC